MTKLQLDRIDHYVHAATDLEPAYKAFTALGLTASEPSAANTDTNSASCAFMVGGVAIEHLAVRDREVPPANPAEADIVRHLDAGGGPYFIIFPVTSLDTARDAFDAHGGSTETVMHVFDSATITLLRPNDSSGAGYAIQLAEYPAELLAMQSQFATLSQHEFPITRVDHLAIIPSDFDASTQYWTDVLGVALQDEVTRPDAVARRFKVGDLVIELLKPAGNSSPLATMPTGLLPLVAFEVDDVEAAVALARERGFTASDPVPGPVEGTLVASIPADELAGTSFELQQYT